MPSLVCEEQKGFIHDRNIKDCLCIASEAVNLLHNKSFGGNLALKIDISKAFDTLDWNFLIKVLKTFGFNEVFCNWIKVILHSAHLSIAINGKSHGYFTCSRGVRQGDPLSPLLFCLAEDVLSRSISKLVTQGKLNQIKGSRNFMVPSHSLYADDILVFCKGNLSGIKALKSLFDQYAQESGQVINSSKSTILSSSITSGRLDLIVQVLNFKLVLFLLIIWVSQSSTYSRQGQAKIVSLESFFTFHCRQSSACAGSDSKYANLQFLYILLTCSIT
jgi:hypothetical protein